MKMNYNTDYRSKGNTFRDTIEHARELLRAAEGITTLSAAHELHDHSTDLLNEINEALGTGFYTGDSYTALWTAKSTLIQVQETVGNRAMKGDIK